VADRARRYEPTADGPDRPRTSARGDWRLVRKPCPTQGRNGARGAVGRGARRHRAPPDRAGGKRQRDRRGYSPGGHSLACGATHRQRARAARLHLRGGPVRGDAGVLQTPLPRAPA
jgi:hypothetical protein